MTVTMIHSVTGAIVTGINEKFVARWKLMGFIIKSYDSDKIIPLRRVG